jgi:hypothetical protein
VLLGEVDELVGRHRLQAAGAVGEPDLVGGVGADGGSNGCGSSGSSDGNRPWTSAEACGLCVLRKGRFEDNYRKVWRQYNQALRDQEGEIEAEAEVVVEAEVEAEVGGSRGGGVCFGWRIWCPKGIGGGRRQRQRQLWRAPLLGQVRGQVAQGVAQGVVWVQGVRGLVAVYWRCSSSPKASVLPLPPPLRGPCLLGL